VNKQLCLDKKSCTFVGVYCEHNGNDLFSKIVSVICKFLRQVMAVDGLHWLLTENEMISC